MEEIIFPNQIRMFRRVRGKPMKSLANILGLSLSAISKIEKGYRRIDDEQLEIISQFLDCPKEDIFVTEQSSQPEVIKAWKREQDRRRKINAGSGLKTLGAGLRYLRGQKALTLQDVSKGAKMTLSVYHRIEMGQREVDEKTLHDIAHALGYSASDLQLKIYELDMSGALDELKQNETKSGIYISKGGYNDLPVSRFMLRNANAQEINAPIFGFPNDDGTIVLDKEQPIGAVLCPSTLSYDPEVFGIRIKNAVFGPLIPIDSVLVVSPNSRPKEGDMAVVPVGDGCVRPVSLQTNSKTGDLEMISFIPSETTAPATKEDVAKMQRVVMVALP